MKGVFKVMNVCDAAKERRTVRKFVQKEVEKEKLDKLINVARFAATAANMQPLKYMIVDSRDKDIYPLTKWAGYLSGWEPAENERPLVYIAVLTDTSIKPAEKSEVDCGSAIATMMLAAEDLGLGTCWLGAINRPAIKELLALEDKYYVSYLLAVGYPAQKGEVFDIQNNNVKYYFDEEENSHVPKRTMEEILIG